MKKFIIIVVIGTVVGIAIYINFFKTNNKPALPSIYNSSQTINVYEMINTDSPSQPLSYSINKNATALDLLQKTTKMSMQGEGENAYITEINGKKAISSNREYWAFYVNGKLAEVGAGSYQLHPNDHIEWKINKY